jgi:radical SAM protein with 4Fe4S-binding SPASM domain
VQKLKKIYLEISNICNLQCSFCPEVERGKKILSAADFKETVEKIQDHTEELALHLMGEPLAHPEFPIILKSTTLPLNITTNGILISRFADLLLETPHLRQINFSVHSFKNNFPDRPLKEYLTPLLEFCRKANTLRPDLYINFRLWNQTQKDQINNENDEILDSIEEFFDLKIPRLIDVSSIKSKKLIGRTYIHFDSLFDWPSLSSKTYATTGKCYGLTHQIGIHANGDVVPCCLDKEAKLKLGNIFETDLKTIRKSERAKKIIKGFKENILVEELCQKCQFRTRFD